MKILLWLQAALLGADKPAVVATDAHFASVQRNIQASLIFRSLIAIFAGMNGMYREEIKRASDVLYRGGIILYPTDTVWGIGCDATNEEAVRRVYEIKRRVDSKAMLVLVDSDVKVDFYVREVPPVAWDLIELSTKPLTIIYDGARNLASNLVADDGSVGIRVTREEFSKQLCFRFRKAIVSTSANVSGQPTPRCFAEISDEIKQAVDYVVGVRQDEPAGAAPSSIIRLGAHGEVKVIRE